MNLEICSIFLNIVQKKGNILGLFGEEYQCITGVFKSRCVLDFWHWMPKFEARALSPNRPLQQCECSKIELLKPPSGGPRQERQLCGRGGKRLSSLEDICIDARPIFLCVHACVWLFRISFGLLGPIVEGIVITSDVQALD